MQVTMYRTYNLTDINYGNPYHYYLERPQAPDFDTFAEEVEVELPEGYSVEENQYGEPLVYRPYGAAQEIRGPEAPLGDDRTRVMLMDGNPRYPYATPAKIIAETTLDEASGRAAAHNQTDAEPDAIDPLDLAATQSPTGITR